MEELIKKALKAVGLSEDLFIFINVEKEEEIASRIAAFKKAVKVTPKTIEEILENDELAPLVKQHSDKRVTDGIKKYVKNLFKEEGYDPDPDPSKSKIDLPNDSDPAMLKIAEIMSQQTKTIESLVNSISDIKSEKKIGERKTVITGMLKSEGIPETAHNRFLKSIDIEEIPEDKLTEEIAGYKKELTDFGLKTMTPPGEGSKHEQEASDKELEKNLEDWGKKDEKEEEAKK